MQELSKIILEKHQVRKTRKQKTEFIELLQQHIKQPITIQEKGMFKSRNIIVGDLENADIIFTAHYDTQPVLPFPNFITPMNKLIYILMQFVLVFVFLAIEVIIAIGLFQLGIDFTTFQIFNMSYWFLLVGYMLFGKANKHTVNDNTSGVLTLVEILQSTDNHICCVFFDHEEIGLVGSSYFHKEYKKLVENKTIINYDCVSDGDHFLFVEKDINESIKSTIQQFTLPQNKHFNIVSHKKALYPSDHKHFKHNIGVGAFHKKKTLGYYLGKIHTKHDTVLDKQNIELLRQLSLKLTQKAESID